MTNHDNWKTRMLLIGAALGALIGLGTAYLLVRTAEESNQGKPPEIKTGDFIRTALGIVGTMRGIAALGNQKKK